MVTAGTYRKAMLFGDDRRRDLLHDLLLKLAAHYGWQLEAWAVLANHYHFIGRSPTDGSSSLRRLIKHLHSQSARELNGIDGEPGRKVWHNYWDSHVTFEKSYFARLHYVHSNPVRHGLVPVANAYRWCSAAWFEREADESFVRTIYSFPIDRLKVPDEF